MLGLELLMKTKKNILWFVIYRVRAEIWFISRSLTRIIV